MAVVHGKAGREGFPDEAPIDFRAIQVGAGDPAPAFAPVDVPTAHGETVRRYFAADELRIRFAAIEVRPADPVAFEAAPVDVRAIDRDRARLEQAGDQMLVRRRVVEVDPADAPGLRPEEFVLVCRETADRGPGQTRGEAG